MLKPQQRRLLRAQLRDTYVLLKQFRLSLLFFIVLITMGTGLFWLFYESPADQSHLTRVFRRLEGVTPARYRRAFLH